MNLGFTINCLTTCICNSSLILPLELKGTLLPDYLYQHKSSFKIIEYLHLMNFMYVFCLQMPSLCRHPFETASWQHHLGCDFGTPSRLGVINQVTLFSIPLPSPPTAT